MVAETFRCADSAEARDEPLYGTASFVRRWLLVEQPGPWGRDALMESRIPAPIATELRRRSLAEGVRVILIRRGTRLSSDRRHCYFVRTDGRDLHQSYMAIDDVADLLDVDLAALRLGETVPGSTESLDPLFLVCTHGRHDACCAIRGNYVARAACADSASGAWECSHIGGDRFAATVVCFPHGVYYGRVTPGEVVSLMHDYAGGSISLDHYRGRCCYPFAIQAAEFFARRESATTGADAVDFESVTRTAQGLVASFTIDGDRRATVDVRIGASAERLLTCSSTRPEPIPRYELVDCTFDPT